MNQSDCSDECLIVFLLPSERFITGEQQRRSMSNEKSFDVKYKVLLLGDTLVGKTSLQRFIVGKDFRTDIGSTIGMIREPR